MTINDGMVIGSVKVVDNGLVSRVFNIVFVSEGYTQSQLGNFASDVNNFASKLFVTSPFDEFKNAINIFRIDVASTDSGTDDPTTCADGSTGSGAKVNTYFDSSVCSSGIRRAMSCDEGLVYSVVNQHVPQGHVIMLLVNSTLIAGSASSFATFTNHMGWEDTAIHEMGHKPFGLADEYDCYSCTTAETGHNKWGGFLWFEPYEPNITSISNISSIKWRSFINPSTPMPTTINPDPTCATRDASTSSPVSAGTVGAFEGAGYFHCGLFRPEFNCRMRNEGVGFCAVCKLRIRTRMLPFSWVHIGHANDVVAMAAAGSKLFAATKDNKLWWRDAVGTNVNWAHISHANDVVAMASTYAANTVKLFAATKDNNLWWRDAVGTSVGWVHIGHANDVVAMAGITVPRATAGQLFAATKDNKLWARSAVGTNVNWAHIGHANDVVAMTAINDKLYAATKDNKLWWRDPVGTNVNWVQIGPANDVVAMAAAGSKLFAATKDNKLLWKAA